MKISLFFRNKLKYSGVKGHDGCNLPQMLQKKIIYMYTYISVFLISLYNLHVIIIGRETRQSQRDRAQMIKQVEHNLVNRYIWAKGLQLLFVLSLVLRPIFMF